MSRYGNARRANRHQVGGFSLIEVLIALVILALGLLGFALLQTLNLRYTQSANYRTQATNLAYDLLDQMRSNHYAAAWYASCRATSLRVNADATWARSRSNRTWRAGSARCFRPWATRRERPSPTTIVMSWSH